MSPTLLTKEITFNLVTFGRKKQIFQKYRVYTMEDIQRVEKDGFEIQIIAGESLRVQYRVYTMNSKNVLRFHSKARAQMGGNR